VPRILLIDDTPEIAELLRSRCVTLDTSLRLGIYGTVNDLIVQQAHALVLDCTAFDMSEALFDSVRHHPDHAELPVVIISDTPEQAEASLAFAKGAQSSAGSGNHLPARRSDAPRAAACINMPLWSMDECNSGTRGRHRPKAGSGPSTDDVLASKAIPTCQISCSNSSTQPAAFTHCLRSTAGRCSASELCFFAGGDACFGNLLVAFIDGSLDPSLACVSAGSGGLRSGRLNLED